MSCHLCFPNVIGPPNPPPKPLCNNADCLFLPHLLVGSSNSVGPCDEEGLVPFENTGLNTTLCGLLPPTFSIRSHSDIFKDVTIDATGIKFTTTISKSNDPVGIIEYGVSCGQYSQTATVTIILKNLCVGSMCASNEVCNKCTGICELVVGDITIGKTATALSGSSGLIIG